LFILRQTIGFGRDSHTISITQFQKYCGLKKRDTAISAIQELEACSLIKVVRKTGCLNEFSLTLNQYHQKGLVPSKGTSTTAKDYTSTLKGDGTSTAKQDAIKENIKETPKENNNYKAPSDFVPQDRGALNFIEYHLEDRKLYTLKDLFGTYPVKKDFMAQAAVSSPKLSQEIVLGQLYKLCEWSSGKPERTSQAWMVTWLKWLRNYQPEKHQAPKTSKKSNSNLNVNDAWKNQATHHAPATGTVEIPEDFV